MTMTINGSNGLVFPDSSAQASGAKVLQVVQGTTSTAVNVATNTYTDTTLTATITPSKTSSKILVFIEQQYLAYATGNTNFAAGGIRVLRASTVIHDSVTNATGPFEFGVYVSGATDLSINHVATFQILDSPNTTSAVTYKTQGRPYNSTNINLEFQSGSTGANSTSRIVLMEIAG